MAFVTLMLIAAMVAMIAALALGVSSMVRDGEVGHLDSEHWMAIRVFLQADGSGSAGSGILRCHLIDIRGSVRPTRDGGEPGSFWASRGGPRVELATSDT